MDAPKKMSFRPPNTIFVDSTTKEKYRSCRFLGKGAFGKCYEFRNVKTMDLYAGKVVSKSALTRSQSRTQIFQEIAIHRELSHLNVVQFHCYFEDDSNVYIVLELCNKRSLMEMHRRRKTLTLPEVRYFIKQIAQACKYLRDQKIIHRDLKLGNLFITDDMVIKVGDFGLATVVSRDGERKKTMCGTPNYIAPEILNRSGHSYEVDIWSLGCIMYTLLVGTPPFETTSLKITYHKIKKNDYDVPKEMHPDACALIKKMLHPECDRRPTPDEILEDHFLTRSLVPTRLPTSCLTITPKFFNVPQDFETLTSVTCRRPLTESNVQESSPLKVATAINRKLTDPKNPVKSDAVRDDFHLSELVRLLTSLSLQHLDEMFNVQDEDIQDPSLIPFVWISKWVDYTDKYGIGYQLCDNSLGILFNDNTRMILLADELNLHYIANDKNTEYCDVENYPSHLKKKITVLNYFLTYMKNNLLKAGDKMTPRDGDEFTRVPHLNFWYRDERSIMFHLTNGTFQVNFKDHTKLILCPIMEAASYIGEDEHFATYNLKLIQKHGCHKALASRLRYAKNVILKLSGGTIVNGLLKIKRAVS